MSAMLMTGTRRTQLQDLHRSQRECEAYWRLPDPPFYQQGGLQGAPCLLESLPTTFRDSPRARNGSGRSADVGGLLCIRVTGGLLLGLLVG